MSISFFFPVRFFVAFLFNNLCWFTRFLSIFYPFFWHIVVCTSIFSFFDTSVIATASNPSFFEID